MYPGFPNVVLLGGGATGAPPVPLAPSRAFAALVRVQTAQAHPSWWAFRLGNSLLSIDDAGTRHQMTQLQAHYHRCDPGGRQRC